MHHSMLRRPITMPNRQTTHKLDRTIADRTADMVSVIKFSFLKRLIRLISYRVPINNGWKLVSINRIQFYLEF